MSSVKSKRPVFSELTAAESRSVLRRNHVGRLCFLNRGVVDVQPVHYVLNDGWIFVRSAFGSKLEAFAHYPYVAFEVDEVDGTFDWRSVVAHGTIYFLEQSRGRIERQALDRAVRALRAFLPEALSRGDPIPFRRTVYGIHIDTLSGRMAEPAGRSSKRRAARPQARRGTVPRAADGF